MPKAKKIPKTEKMWMAWDRVDGGFFTHRASEIKDDCQSKIMGSSMCDALIAVRVRIVPEAEYQRMRKTANHIADAGKMVDGTK